MRFLFLILHLKFSVDFFPLNIPLKYKYYKKVSFFMDALSSSLSVFDVFLSVHYLCFLQVAPFLSVLVSSSHVRGFLQMSDTLGSWLICMSGM